YTDCLHRYLRSFPTRRSSDLVSKPTSSKSLCLPETRKHFCVSAIRVAFGTALPKKYSLNCAMPELLNIKVGSSFKTIGAEGTIKRPLLSKKSRNFFLISCDFIRYINYESFTTNTLQKCITGAKLMIFGRYYAIAIYYLTVCMLTLKNCIL